MNILDWLYKLWRNPTWMCSQCLAFYKWLNFTWPIDNYKVFYESRITKGFYKNHTHNVSDVNLEVTRIMPAPVYYWHVHHEVLAEALTEPIQNRINYIKQSKATDEVPTRLHLMRPVVNPPKGGVDNVAVAKAEKVFKAVAEANAVGNSNNETLQRAYNALVAARKTATTQPTQDQWEALHKKECFWYCPWNGVTIFPAGKVGHK